MQRDAGSGASLSAAVRKDPVCLFAFGFGAGAVPRAPGTAGTALAVPLYLLVAPLPLFAYAALVLMLFAAGVWICARTEKQLEMHDHPAIVWDEIVGYLVTMLAAPSGWRWVVGGFALFRLFDIWKPFPIRVVERRLQGGLGTMADDALAALYAWLSLRVVAFFVSTLSVPSPAVSPDPVSIDAERGGQRCKPRRRLG
jgi:phosphatidylglycerophosphatase A